jgi:hypothetical protein
MLPTETSERRKTSFNPLPDVKRTVQALKYGRVNSRMREEKEEVETILAVSRIRVINV